MRSCRSIHSSMYRKTVFLESRKNLSIFAVLGMMTFGNKRQPLDPNQTFHSEFYFCFIVYVNFNVSNAYWLIRGENKGRLSMQTFTERPCLIIPRIIAQWCTPRRSIGGQSRLSQATTVSLFICEHCSTIASSLTAFTLWRLKLNRYLTTMLPSSTQVTTTHESGAKDQ